MTVGLDAVSKEGSDEFDSAAAQDVDAKARLPNGRPCHDVQDAGDSILLQSSGGSRGGRVSGKGTPGNRKSFPQSINACKARMGGVVVEVEHQRQVDHALAPQSAPQPVAPLTREVAPGRGYDTSAEVAQVGDMQQSRSGKVLKAAGAPRPYPFHHLRLLSPRAVDRRRQVTARAL